MDKPKKKLDLIQWIMKEEDVKFLNHVQNYFDELDYDRTCSKEIIGYGSNGQEVNKSIFLHNIKECEFSVSNGEFFTFDDLERQSEKW